MSRRVPLHTSYFAQQPEVLAAAADSLVPGVVD